MKTRIVLFAILLFGTIAFCRSGASAVHILTLNMGQEPATNVWRGLLPLHSMRADVEKLLGKPTLSNGSALTYETQHERINVLYSTGRCELSGVERWDVAAGTVIRIEVSPSGKLPVSDLHLSKETFIRIQLAHPKNWVQYWNQKEGVVVHTILYGRDEEVYVIAYQPKQSDEALACHKD